MTPKKGEIAGTGRSFDPATRIEHEFTVMGDGEPVLTASDLEEFEGRHSTAEGLIEGIREWLRLPIPQDLSELSTDELTIVIAPDDDEDEPGETLGELDDLSSGRLHPELLALGQAIREERDRQGLSVDALAAAARVDTNRLLALEAGELDPDYDLLIALAQALDIQPSRFVTRAEANRNLRAQQQVVEPLPES
ncbi:MAG TPA: helix-turn-helix transcriptional regulator [Solirubrobacteraceae bacterium]